MQTCTHMKCYLEHEKPTDTKQIEQGLCCKVIWDKWTFLNQPYNKWMMS